MSSFLRTAVLRGRPLPPAIVLGGRANALSVARSLGRVGVTVYALNEPGSFVRHSRYCRQLDVHVRADDPDPGRGWARFLLGPGAAHLRGAVLLACSDESIELLLAHRRPLAERFRLDESNPTAQRAMLDKLTTYDAARAAGVPTPRYWVAESRDHLNALSGELTFPLIVKPRRSHFFEGRTGSKLVIAERFEQVAAAVDAIAATGTQSLLVEMIPGPDDQLCSYFTYLDADSRPLFAFTKRIIRRYPALMGTACYHVTDRIPEVAELGDRLFRHVGLRGVANVEFKRDARDGRLKLIECNARFTASDCLAARSGFDLPAFVYNRVTGHPAPAMRWRAVGMRLWDPVRDFQSFLELRRKHGLTLGRWLGGLLHPQTFPYFEWSDPMPALARLTLPLRRRLGLAPVPRVP